MKRVQSATMHTNKCTLSCEQWPVALTSRKGLGIAPDAPGVLLCMASCAAVGCTNACPRTKQQLLKLHHHNQQNPF